jgi:hypothetical protein
MALPEATERTSHGEPAWFVAGKKQFLMYADQHHDDRVGFWCAALHGVQEEMIEAAPNNYFRPPYVGGRGWLGVYLDVPDVDWVEVGALITDAYRAVAPKKLGALLAEQ